MWKLASVAQGGQTPLTVTQCNVQSEPKNIPSWYLSSLGCWLLQRLCILGRYGAIEIVLLLLLLLLLLLDALYFQFFVY